MEENRRKVVCLICQETFNSDYRQKIIFDLTFITEILRHCKDASSFLRNSKNSLGDAVRIIDTIVENNTALKNDEIYGHLENNSTDLIIEHDINEYEKAKCKVNLPMRFYDQILEPTVGKRDEKDFTTTLFHPLVDRCLSELHRRFSMEIWK